MSAPLDAPARVPTLVISGPVGVGKTSVALELSIHLEQRGVPHTVVDLDALTVTSPRLDHDPFGEALAVQNLRAVWSNARDIAGSNNLVIARVIKSERQLADLLDAVPGNATTLVRLRASEDVLRSRVRQREIGSAADWHEQRAVDLATSLETVPSDAIIDTSEGPVASVASRLADLVRWET